MSDRVSANRESSRPIANATAPSTVAKAMLREDSTISERIARSRKIMFSLAIYEEAPDYIKAFCDPTLTKFREWTLSLFNYLEIKPSEKEMEKLTKSASAMAITRVPDTKNAFLYYFILVSPKEGASRLTDFLEWLTSRETLLFDKALVSIEENRTNEGTEEEYNKKLKNLDYAAKVSVARTIFNELGYSDEKVKTALVKSQLSSGAASTYEEAVISVDTTFVFINFIERNRIRAETPTQ